MIKDSFKAKINSTTDRILMAILSTAPLKSSFSFTDTELELLLHYS